MSTAQNAATLLWSAADAAGAAPAVVERDGEIPYQTLLGRATAIGAALAAAGAAAESPVAILLERGVDAAAAFFGVLAVGAIAVFVNEALRPRQIEHILAHSGSRVLLTTRDVLARLPRPLNVAVRVLDLRAVATRAGDGGLLPVPRRDSDPAQIIYTSGSSGPPKGVTLSHANLRAAADVVTSYLSITRTDRIASLLPFGFVYGLSQLLCAAKAAAALVVERSPLPQQIVATLRSHRATVLAAVPALWRRLLGVAGFAGAPLPHLRVLTNAGGRMPVDTVRALRRAQPHARLYLMYGFTEAMRGTYLPAEEVDRRPDSIGRPIPGALIDVVREDGTEAAPGEVGELIQAGPTVTLGYWNDPVRTAQVFRPHPWRPGVDPVVFSGDLVRRDEEGYLYFVGRKDRMIKTLGYRVGPDDVAEVLYASGQVADAAVLGHPDPDWGQRIVAYVVLTEGGSLERLRAFCARELPRFLQPARIEVCDALPLLPNGKPDLAAMASRSAP